MSTVSADREGPLVVYIHGFKSSPASIKAGLVRQWLKSRGKEGRFRCPDLPYGPAAAAKLLETEIQRLLKQREQLVLIGSSLGGYYATWLAERHNLRAVVVNPGIWPYEFSAVLIGPQKNLYTAEEFVFTEAHLEELRCLEVEPITPSRYLLMVTTGDEVIDYRRAVDRYRGAKMRIVEGSDHGFSDFAAYLPEAMEFCGFGKT